MKRMLVSSILLILILAGCGNDGVQEELPEDKPEEQTEAKEEVAEDLVEEASSTLNTDGKETLAIDLLEEKALYKFEGVEEGAAYLVYFYAENESETPLDASSYVGEAGDVMLSGDYFFYVATKEDDVAYKQDQLDALSLEFNEKTVNHPTIQLADSTLISVFSHEGINLFEPHLYSLHEGELVQFDSSELGAVFTTKLKALDDNKFQTVSYLNTAEPSDFGWHFQTFEADRESFVVTRVADAVFNDTNWGLDAGKERYQLWMEDEKSFVPYNDIQDLIKIEVTTEMLDLAVKNELGDIPVKLGDDMTDLMAQNKELEVKVPFSGSQAVRFLGYVVYFNPTDYEPLNYTGEIVLLALPPERIQMTADEVIDVLGEPLSHGYDEYTQEYSAIYQAGDNILKFSYLVEGNPVSVELRY